MYVRASHDAAAIMAVSAGTKESVSAVGVPAARVEVVPNVLRTDEIAPSADGRARLRAELGMPEHAFVVGCISRFHRKKRNDVVVEAVRLLDERVHLVLAGDGETEGELRALAAPLNGRAHFIAHARRQRRRSALGLRRVGLLPESHRGRPARGDPGDARRTPVPIHRRGGRRGHDHPGDRRDR